MWTSDSQPPGDDEHEITVIGPGYGECVVVHLGNQKWAVIDSCIGPETKEAVAVGYLAALGLDPATCISLVVVSHWDDDHIRGMDRVVEVAAKAVFYFSPVLPSTKFLKFIRAMSAGNVATDGANVRAISRIFELLAARGQYPRHAQVGQQLWAAPSIQAWSPSGADVHEFYQMLVQNHPARGQSFRSAVLPKSANLSSIVLSVKWADGTSVLLGGDMEVSSDPQRGWGAVISEASRLCAPVSSVVKIPHHGSETGHYPAMWSQLLEEKPISVIAPFGRGLSDSRPPTQKDRRRIRELSGSIFITSNSLTPKPHLREAEVIRALRYGGIEMEERPQRIGAVRLRRRPGQEWRVDTLGAAVRI